MSERDGVLVCVSPRDPEREVALVAEGFCPRCGAGLAFDGLFSARPTGFAAAVLAAGWCSACRVG